MFLTPDDFVDYYLIALDDFSEDKLQECIDIYEKRSLQDMFGVALYNLFIADLTGAPANPAAPPLSARFIAVFNEFAEDLNTSGDCGCSGLNRSEGILTMLKGFIYWHYVKNQPIKNTVTGPVKNVNENSVVLDARQAGIFERYNRAITSYQAIQQYMIDRPSDYPEFRGIKKRGFIFGQ